MTWRSVLRHHIRQAIDRAMYWAAWPFLRRLDSEQFLSPWQRHALGLGDDDQ